MGDDSMITKELAGIKMNETVPADMIDPELAGRAQTNPKKFVKTGTSPVHFAPNLVDLDRQSCSCGTPIRVNQVTGKVE